MTAHDTRDLMRRTIDAVRQAHADARNAERRDRDALDSVLAEYHATTDVPDEIEVDLVISVGDLLTGDSAPARCHYGGGPHDDSCEAVPT